MKKLFKKSPLEKEMKKEAMTIASQPAPEQLLAAFRLGKLQALKELIEEEAEEQSIKSSSKK